MDVVDEEEIHADWGALRVAVPVFVAIVSVAAVGFVAFRALSGGDSQDQAAEAAAEEEEPVDLPEDLSEATPAEAAAAALATLADRLPNGRFSGLEFAFSEPAEADADYASVTSELGEFTLTAAPGPVTIIDSVNAAAPITLSWTLDDGVEFTTEGEVDIVLIGTEWLVDWEVAVLENSLDPGDVLVRERVVPVRAPIVGRNDVPLVDNRPIINIGVVPRQADDIEVLGQRLGPLIGQDPAEIVATISPRPSDSFVLLSSTRAEEVASIQGQLQAIPGVVLEEATFPLAPNDRFARALLGRSAEVTAEIIEESPEVFIAGDVAGRSGLQRVYNERLAGVPGFQIRIKRRFAAPADVLPGETDEAGEPLDPDVVYLSAPVQGVPLRLTIDQQVQTAAENALAATELPSALVAVEASTGHVLAVANGPGAATNNFALTGQYPPGSTFKVVTAYAAMQKGVQITDPVDCPFSLNVNGREFSNSEGEVLGIVPLRQAFVLSCNTAFINLSSVLDPSDFSRAAAELGIGAEYSLGTASFSGNVPNPSGPVEKAATSFGQAQIVVSPLSAAVMAASVASGTYNSPALVLPAGNPEAGGEADPENQAGDPAETGAQPLDQTPIANLQTMMRAVVTNGTGRAVAGTPGGPVSGKTGTAEFGNEVPPRSHAWFVGFQGDVAFAVFVEGGEFGGSTAAPIAGQFLSQLSGG